MEDMVLDYGAITIDNSVLKGEGYRFDEGLLKQMNQFAKSPVKVIQTDVVHNEAIKHLSEDIKNARTSIAQALRSASKHFKISAKKIDEAKALLVSDISDYEIANARLRQYYQKINCELLISSDYVELERLMQMYFEVEAPFEQSKDKKHEFPDAIAPLAIEGRAEKNDINVIAVSNDKGWKAFADNSHRITVIEKLADAFEVFLPHNKINEIISQLREDELLDGENHVLSKITQAISDSLEDIDLNIEAASYLNYEEDEVYSSYVSHEFEKDGKDLVSINVVSIEDDVIVLQVRAKVICEVTASFYFSVRDSIDKDYVNLGETNCSTEISYRTDILIHLTGDFSQSFNELSVSEIEVLETPKHVDFGQIEPNWGDHDKNEDE